MTDRQFHFFSLLSGYSWQTEGDPNKYAFTYAMPLQDPTLIVINTDTGATTPTTYRLTDTGLSMRLSFLGTTYKLLRIDASTIPATMTLENDSGNLIIYTSVHATR